MDGVDDRGEFPVCKSCSVYSENLSKLIASYVTQLFIEEKRIQFNRMGDRFGLNLNSRARAVIYREPDVRDAGV
jgi:hypothetical protein